jgi:hypothetical protein
MIYSSQLPQIPVAVQMSICHLAAESMNYVVSFGTSVSLRGNRKEVAAFRSKQNTLFLGWHNKRLVLMPQHISHHRCHLNTKSERSHNSRYVDTPVICECTTLWMLLTRLLSTKLAKTSRRKHAYDGRIWFLVAAGSHSEEFYYL